MAINKLVALSGIAAVALVVNACGTGESTGDDTHNVAVNFAVSGAPSSPASASSFASGAESAPSLIVSGSNGTLTITEIHVIVAEVELEPADGSCDFMDNASDDDGDSDGECPDFEAPPQVLNLPLDGSPIQAVAGLIPAGTYDELEFEIEDLEDDEDNPEEAAAILALLEAIHADIDAEWPEKASARVVGNFDGGSGPVPFRVFLEAEIEVERDLVPNLVVADDGTTSSELTVNIRPDIWFTNPDDTVLNLSNWDYAMTLMLLELEIEMENGITDIEIDVDDRDDSDDS